MHESTDILGYFMVVKTKLNRLTNRSLQLNNNFAISGGAAGRRCCAHICVREVLHWVYRRHAAITIPEKVRIFFALSLCLDDVYRSFFLPLTPFQLYSIIFLYTHFKIKYVSHLGLYPRNVVSANSSRKIDRREPVLNLRTQNKEKHINFETTWWLRVWDKNYKLTAR